MHGSALFPGVSKLGWQGLFRSLQSHTEEVPTPLVFKRYLMPTCSAMPSILSLCPKASLSFTNLVYYEWKSRKCFFIYWGRASYRFSRQYHAPISPPVSSSWRVRPHWKLRVIGSCVMLLEVVSSGWLVAGRYLLGGHGGDVIWSLSVWERVIYGLRVCLWNYRLIASFLSEPLNPC